jgi:hypothetical protein
LNSTITSGSATRAGAVLACVAIFGLTGCGAQTRTATNATARGLNADPSARIADPIKRRLEAAGYAIYPRSTSGPRGALFYVDVDWTTQHAFRLYISVFPSTAAATAYFGEQRRNGERFARTYRIAAVRRIVYEAVGGEFWGGMSPTGGRTETGALPAKDFRAVVAIATGRRSRSERAFSS